MKELSGRGLRRIIRKAVYAKFGWSVSEWARRRGYRPDIVWHAIYGNYRVSGKRKAAEILRRLAADTEIHQLSLLADEIEASLHTSPSNGGRPRREASRKEKTASPSSPEGDGKEGK